MRLCMLEAVESELCLLEVMRCMLLCMLDAVESGLSFRDFEISIVAVFSVQTATSGNWHGCRRADTAVRSGTLINDDDFLRPNFLFGC